MVFVNLREVVDLVAAQVTLCPLPLVWSETRWAVSEYLKKTRAWRHVARGILLTPETESYCLGTPPGTMICSVYSVRIGSHELNHIAGEGEVWPETGGVARRPEFWTFRNGRIFLFPVCEAFDIPRPDGAEEWPVMDVLCSLTTEGRNPDLPEWLDRDEISWGALGKLFTMQGQPWSNPEIGMYFDNKFTQAIARKRIERMHGGRPGSLLIQAPLFGGYF